MHGSSRISRIIFCTTIVLFACPVWVAAGPQAQTPPDAICQALFQEYIVRSGKISTSDELAAAELIASRGRTTGFWKPVLEGLRTVKGWDEIRYVRILGLMLAADAHARDNIKSGQASKMQMISIVALPKEVVPELISRAETAISAESGSYVGDAYTLALARARDPRAKEFLQRMVKSENHGGNWQSVKFHAALGLAELGEPVGMEWLIAHSDDDSDGIVWGRPQYASRQQLSLAVVAALQVLSGQPALSTKTEFQAWWKTAAATFAPKSHVSLVD